jgi:N-acetylmuramoyl-L-alanine amidase
MNSLIRLTLSILLLLMSSQAWARTEIINLRHWTAPEHTRVVIDTDEEIQYTVEKSASKVQLQLANAVLSKDILREYILNKPGIARIAFSVPAAGNVRLEPYRLVVDITLPEVEKEESQAREQIKVVKKDKIIVIDPGHGGEDPGATGKRGTTEKKVVLAIGKKLKDVLNSGAGTRAFLTREGDYYVPFKKRLSIARELGADLFISIHADAARNRIARGSSVYCLSTGGATSEAAKILARKENMADIVGGAMGEGNGKGESDPIILNMFQTNTINQSRNFGNTILNDLGRINSIKFAQVQEAPFRVLKFPEIPAILIETAYISNLQEESNLRGEKFQTELAASIGGAVRRFFSIPEPPAAKASPADDKIGKTAKSQAAETRPGPAASYKVEKGDPLKKTSRTPRRPIYHKVGKGDTIVKIARRYQVPVSVLLKLNKMKLRDPLYIGRELRLPLPPP